MSDLGDSEFSRAFIPRWGERVFKRGSGYSGPGVIRGFAVTADGSVRIVVAHKIAGGIGELLHLYAASQLSLMGLGSDQPVLRAVAQIEALRAQIAADD